LRDPKQGYLHKTCQMALGCASVCKISSQMSRLVCSAPNILPQMSCLGCPAPVVGQCFRFPGHPDSAVLFWCHLPVVISLMSCPGCLVLISSCCVILAFLSSLSWAALSWLSFFDSPGLPVLSSLPRAVLQSCRGCTGWSVLEVLSQLSYPGCPAIACHARIITRFNYTDKKDVLVASEETVLYR
jgi:hypothetical protein